MRPRYRLTPAILHDSTNSFVKEMVSDNFFARVKLDAAHPVAGVASPSQIPPSEYDQVIRDIRGSLRINHKKAKQFDPKQASTYFEKEFGKANAALIKKHFSQNPSSSASSLPLVEASQNPMEYMFKHKDQTRDLYSKGGRVFLKTRATDFDLTSTSDENNILIPLKGYLESVYILEEEGFKLVDITTDNALLYELYMGNYSYLKEPEKHNRTNLFLSAWWLYFKNQWNVTFHEIFNPEGTYTSNTNAFFRIPWKFPYVTEVISVVVNFVKLFSEAAPALIETVGSTLLAASLFRFTKPLGWGMFPAFFGVLIGATLKASGWFARQVGRTFTSPLDAAKETYTWVKQNTGGGIFGTILGGLAATIRLAPVVFVLLTVGLPALPAALGKIGVAAASAIKYGLGYVGGWIASSFGSTVTANAAASASASFTASSTLGAVVSTTIGTSALLGAMNYAVKKLFSWGKQAYNYFKNKETLREAQPLPPQPTPASGTLRLTIDSKRQADYDNEGVYSPPGAEKDPGTQSPSYNAAARRRPPTTQPQNIPGMLAAANHNAVPAKPSSRAVLPIVITADAGDLSEATSQQHLTPPSGSDAKALIASQQQSGLITSSPQSAATASPRSQSATGVDPSTSATSDGSPDPDSVTPTPPKSPTLP